MNAQTHSKIVRPEHVEEECLAVVSAVLCTELLEHGKVRGCEDLGMSGDALRTHELHVPWLSSGRTRRVHLRSSPPWLTAVQLRPRCR